MRTLERRLDALEQRLARMPPALRPPPDPFKVWLASLTVEQLRNLERLVEILPDIDSASAAAIIGADIHPHERRP